MTNQLKPGEWIDEMAEVPPEAWPQLTALRLAAAIEDEIVLGMHKVGSPADCAAAELRRLHSVNAQLLEALDYFMQCVEQSAHLDARIGFMGGAFDKARAAIAAAKEMK